MQIYFTDNNPKKCAQVIDNLRVSKLICETAQCLNYAAMRHGYIGTVGLSQNQKSAYLNNPIVKWLSESKQNYKWGLVHLKALLQVKSKRFGTAHLFVKHVNSLSKLIKYIPNGELTEFPNVTKNYKHIKPTTEAYQLHLLEKWEESKRKVSWNERG
jgi:hypothetical protein